MSIGRYEGTVHSDFAGHPGRDYLKLCGEKIILLNAEPLLDKPEKLVLLAYRRNDVEILRREEVLKLLLLQIMRQMRQEHGYDMVILMLTDVLQEGTQLLYIGSDETIRNAFAVEPKDNTVFLPGVMSRKKQVVPMLTTLWG